jgi:hypothetical protein
MIHWRGMGAEQIGTATQTCPACGTQIDTTSAEPLARVTCPACGEKVRVERAFNNFVIVETLGVGGMGTVYKARDTLLDRFVAMKLLRQDLGEVDHAARLQQEARVAASVNHANVIQVFSSGTDHGKFYLVMELVDHGSLDDWIEERKQLPEDVVLMTGIQVAKGLRAAHGKGLIHRDVKPANILFADDHTAKIGDFGLAGAAAETGEHAGEIWGTPYYVAPERLKNEPEDFRSDIYSLGATLFHALAGRAPIEGETNSATALYQLKTQPLDLRKVVPNVSSETAAVLARMIAPEPEERFASYDELVSELENAYGVLTGNEQFLRSKKSRTRWYIGIGVLLAALIAVGAWAWTTRQHARKTETESARFKTQAEQLIALAPLEAQMSDARRQLVQNHYNVASAAFARIALDAKGRQPLSDWARMQQGLSAMVAREMSQARQAFQDIENTGARGFSNDDLPLSKFFLATAKALGSSGAIAPEALAPAPSGPEIFAAFPFALHNIAHNDANGAANFLERLMNAKPADKFTWIADYKQLAQKYLDDCRAYLAWKNEPAGTTDAAGRLQKVRQIKLKTRTALADEISAEEKRLAAEVANQQQSQNAARAKEDKARAEQQTGKQRPQWLAEWRRKLIEDLNRAHYNGAIKATNGAVFSGIAGANEQGLQMKLPYGEAQLPWTSFSPQTMLAVSISFVNANAPDAADRQWLAAIYASETGQPAEAKRLGEEAAKLKPEYRAQMSALDQPPRR